MLNGPNTGNVCIEKEVIYNGSTQKQSGNS